MNVHATRDQLPSRGGGGIVFINIYILVFICTPTPTRPATQGGNERTNERTNTETEVTSPPPISSLARRFFSAFVSRLRPLLRVCLESSPSSAPSISTLGSGKRRTGGRTEGRRKNRLSTGPRFVESHLANSVNVVRRRRRRRRRPPPPLPSLLHRGRATSEQACLLARSLSLSLRVGRTAERRFDDGRESGAGHGHRGRQRQLLSGEATSP